MATTLQTCNVKCESYTQAIIPRIHEKLVQGAYCDCVISAEGRFVRAHKLMLSLSSEYFEVKQQVLETSVYLFSFTFRICSTLPLWKSQLSSSAALNLKISACFLTLPIWAKLRCHMSVSTTSSKPANFSKSEASKKESILIYFRSCQHHYHWYV